MQNIMYLQKLKEQMQLWIAPESSMWLLRKEIILERNGIKYGRHLIKNQNDYEII